MAADRVPQPGEVWVFRPYRSLRRGRVTILGVSDDGHVRFRYHGSGTTGDPTPIAAFVRVYDWLAVDEETAIVEHGAQRTPAARSLVDMPLRLGTAVD